MAKRYRNSDALNTVMGTVISVATKLKKRDILLRAERVVPKKGIPEIVVFHKTQEIARFSEEHADSPFEEIKRTILTNLNISE